jgi:7-cyano-7-deazaguanine synthase
MRTSSIVLVSAGLDSAVLVAHEAETFDVRPVYVSVGLVWEAAEQVMLDRLLASEPFAGRVRAAERLEFTMRDVYPPSHWAVRGEPPAYDTPDEDVYLAGRNLVLLTKAGVAASRAGVGRIALGPLAGNPFPDARAEFFAVMGRALTLGLDHAIEIATPFVTWEKEDVIRRGLELGVPLELTLSCMNPVAGSSGSAGSTGSAAPLPLHCGLCSKCRERRDAFHSAGVVDPTTYANRSPR